MARGQTDENGWRYWFDENDGSAVFTTPLEDGTLDIDVSQLQEGLHSLHIQACVDGVLSAPETHLFTKTVETAKADNYDGMLVIDGGVALIEATATMDNGKLEYEFDVSDLAPGMHTLMVAANSPNGVTTGAVEQLFVRELTDTEIGSMRCCYSVDNGEMAIVSGDKTEGVFNFDLDVSGLTDGIHEVTYWLLAENGVSTSRGSAFFLKTTYMDPQKMKCYYTVDNINTTPQEGTLSDGVLHFNLDVSELSDGIHEVTYWVTADNGATSAPESSYFIKIPDGGTGIIEYEYWVNDDFANRRTITLDERVDPLSVITDIDIDPQELRSSNFQMVIIDGQPTMIAVNDLHLRFRDIGGRMTDTTATFADPKVSEEVTEVIPLEPQHTVYVNRPEENGIRWFSAEATEGDSLLFRAGSSCMLQLFSPTGELVYEATGDATTDFGGCSATENGTYYLALHDMATNASTIAVTYRRPDMPGCGDINGDGGINITDVTSMVDYILSHSCQAKDIWNADLNGDGDINISDVTLLVNQILQGI